MYNKALQAETIEESITILNVESRSDEDLEEMAIAFAFWNGDSSIPPTEREEALATICLNELEKREACDS